MDLSRYMNKIVKAPKFKLESTLAALQVIEKDDYIFSFDLKSAYHQIRMNKNFTKYLGFAIEEEDGRKRYFMYLSLPFGLNDAMRVLTKLMKSPLERCRSRGMKVSSMWTIGFGVVKERFETLKASRRVRED